MHPVSGNGRDPAREILGRSRGILEMKALIAKLAPTPVEVLIRGESGTGKELVARSLHENSARSGGSFVSLSCAELGEGVAGSELFGHKRGSFTGAVQGRRGLLEEANGGTLFLDEVGDIPPSIQVKLLRVLETGQVRPVGETTSRRTDLRLLSATNVPLESRIAEGSFRLDLFYRVCGVEIEVPPLRERGGDLEVLTTHFLSMFLADHRPPVWSKDAWSIWKGYAWPGNVRELIHEARRLAALLESRRRIETSDLSARLRTIPGSKAGWTYRPGLRLRAALAAFERDYLRSALLNAGGNRAAAARDLGLTRQGLFKKLKRFDLDPVP